VKDEIAEPIAIKLPSKTNDPSMLLKRMREEQKLREEALEKQRKEEKQRKRERGEEVSDDSSEWSDLE
jgi:hypothetical protein